MRPRLDAGFGDCALEAGALACGWPAVVRAPGSATPIGRLQLPSLLPAVAQGRTAAEGRGAAGGAVGIFALLLAAGILRGEDRRRAVGAVAGYAGILAAEGASGTRGTPAVERCRLVAAAAGSVATPAVVPVVVALVGQDDALEVASVADIGLPKDIRGVELHRAHGQVPLGGDGRIALMLQDELCDGHLLGREA